MVSNLEFMWRGSELFYSANFVMELIFVFIALTISILSYRAYKFTKKSNYFYLFLSFILLSIAYLIRTIDNIFFFFSNISGLINTSNAFHMIITILYLVLTIYGYLVLLISFLNIRNNRLIILLFIMSFLLVLSSYKTIGIFYLTTAMMLFFVIDHLYKNYLKNRSKSTFFLFIAFLLIFIVEIFTLLFKMTIITVFNNLTFSILQVILLLAYTIIIFVLTRIFLKR